VKVQGRKFARKRPHRGAFWLTRLGGEGSACPLQLTFRDRRRDRGTKSDSIGRRGKGENRNTEPRSLGISRKKKLQCRRRYDKLAA